ncbi:hypothetical protein SAMN02745216_02992 [Desulfatibacillum alkenivorans DSM 16219]|jgi:hypothetical protein|uniref:pEK499-p136 HEPN domain-containing protein n=1 Tax=Desulfatibacillum alkenivorans DSM 16219 TaxID=1121393 RepID=A0A1M6Q8L2_9BACT|nr:HEPN family nuclease [Desulfatibacillum alkenivorans]SHK16423.1 hypothetical protein SAMN02745216_02992 [Desulfatibacillum alkenivorans DSM 16219]
MTEMHSFSRDFVKRTHEMLVNSYCHFLEKDKEVTFLLNCLLGLIVTVSENPDRDSPFSGDIDDEFFNVIPNQIGYIQFNELDVGNLCDTQVTSTPGLSVKHKIDLKNNMKKSWFIRKIRHAIAHTNIEPLNQHGSIVSVRLYNITKSKIKDFEIIFTVDQLRVFALYISDEYGKFIR